MAAGFRQPGRRGRDRAEPSCTLVGRTAMDLASRTSCQRTLTWTTNAEFPVGKGAIVQEFVADAGGSRYVIDVAPWGEGRFLVDGREIARVDVANDGRQAFSSLRELAEQYRRGEPIKFSIPR